MNRPNIFDRSFTLTGRELCRLMRVHKVTMRQLKARTGFTLKLIRERRETGLTGHACIDWTEAIAGSITPRMRAALKSHFRTDE